MPLPNAKKYLIVVVGPTAVGKTECCVALAQHLCAEIISADARQCYQGMAVGTAQPTPTEMRGVPHHFINFLPVQAPYSAGMFARDALKVLTTLLCKHDYVFMTGGSGLYLQAVCQGLSPIPPVAPTIRAMLKKRLQTEGLSALVAALASQDPVYYQVVDRGNPQRIIRALEVCLVTGQPYSTFRQHQPAARPFSILKIGLTRDRQTLYQRIDQRVAQMLDQGLLQEAAALYPHRHYNALQTVGYREIFGYLEGHYDQEEAIRLLKRNTKRYAKRQLTWLRRDPAIHWFHPDERDAMLRHVQQKTTAL
ncbi:MAG: tRNA (adenosine(37)-N6)-dimethylallyltransferase MiaA [Amoebophilaceae bacterium]|jgi:tRNA dimethylallyltransferase|nr:tRNA (adenosine(37)-N6)-dimethylallyltransferase MiaA [Amoebophilaceae bacterium]